jgi:hypothetical protein
MNLDHRNVQTIEENPVVISQPRSVAYPGAKIERYEFENLLERAMEIMSARAKSASSRRA